MNAKIDLSGSVFDRITIVKEVPRPEHRTGKGIYYLCRCDCGTEKVLNVHNIRGNFKKYGNLSCGCIKREKLVGTHTTHGMTGSDRYALWAAARYRSRSMGVPFDLAPEDVPEIPNSCPLLEIPLFRGQGKQTANSPSLDRVVPLLGYVRGNVMVISFMANMMKHQASFEQFETMYLNWKRLAAR